MASTEAELEAKEEAAWKRKQERWEAMKTLPPPTAHHYRFRLPASEASSIVCPVNQICPCCKGKMELITSCYGTMLLGLFQKETGEKVRVFEAVSQSYIEKDEYRTLPVLRKVRVCEHCKDKLNEILQDPIDVSLESFRVRDECLGVTQKLTTGRYDRYRGRSRR